MNASLLRILLIALTTATIVHASPAFGFDLEAYQEFLDAHEDMSPEELTALYPAGKFIDGAHFDFSEARYAADIKQLFELTPDEIDLAETNGFMVTERYSTTNFRNMLAQIYHKDMPLYISSDMILDAFHQSYQDILVFLERNVFQDEVAAYLAKSHAQVVNMAEQFADNSVMHDGLMDAELHLAVASALLKHYKYEPLTLYFQENDARRTELIELVMAEEPTSYPLYSDNCDRNIDFSQFKVRGHYVKNHLSEYFRSVMWLGRIGLIIRHSSVSQPRCTPTKEDQVRNAVAAAVLAFAAESDGAGVHLNTIDAALQAFIGEQDNITLADVSAALDAIDVNSIADLANPAKADELHSYLKNNGREQFIVSRILKGANDGKTTDPPLEALALGQRFIIDSYITMNVTFDRIHYKGTDIKRLLPHSQDVLFALGNNASALLLTDELNGYKYADNLGALRFLIDQTSPEHWQSSTYNGWLNAIRQLNPPAREERDNLPRFMQTAAWWQKSMTTQLASWAQLRHDNILYAKPSYGVYVCEFPDAYVEPRPQFYSSIAEACTNIAARYNTLPALDDGIRLKLVDYYENFAATVRTLSTIAEKELNGEALTSGESTFLQKTLRQNIEHNCAINFNTITYDGWYPELFFNKVEEMTNTEYPPEYLIADIHTDTQESQVLHIGTGPVNLALILVDDCDGQPTAYVGPVFSYFEETTLNYTRITDEEWIEKFEDGTIPARPDYTQCYLADRGGVKQNSNGCLLPMEEQTSTGVGDLTADIDIATAPNPFSESTTIRFNLPSTSGAQPGRVAIYTLQGRLCTELFNGIVPTGTSSLRWDGRNSKGELMPSGAYIYRLNIGAQILSGTLHLQR